VKTGEHSTSNIQRPTSKNVGRQAHWAFNVECWALDVCRRGLVLGLWLVLCLSAHADAPSFDDANRLYEQGKYREAVVAYEQLLASGTRSAALWFNLGNAHFKAGHVGDAIAAYRQAERLAPRDADIRANLDFARRQVTGQTLRPSWLQRTLTTLTTNEWTLLALIPVWAWFALMIARQFKPALRPALRRWTWASGAAGLVACAALAFVLSQRFNSQTLVVNSRQTVVRAGPFEESPSAFTAADGAEFALHDAKGDWYQVSDGHKPIGWLKTNTVATVRQ
jgi:tetratricopeptide (TPR) repeat protein